MVRLSEDFALIGMFYLLVYIVFTYIYLRKPVNYRGYHRAGRPREPVQG